MVVVDAIVVVVAGSGSGNNGSGRGRDSSGGGCVAVAVSVAASAAAAVVAERWQCRSGGNARGCGNDSDNVSLGGAAGDANLPHQIDSAASKGNRLNSAQRSWLATPFYPSGGLRFVDLFVLAAVERIERRNTTGGIPDGGGRSKPPNVLNRLVGRGVEAAGCEGRGSEQFGSATRRGHFAPSGLPFIKILFRACRERREPAESRREPSPPLSRYKRRRTLATPSSRASRRVRSRLSRGCFFA